MYDAVFNPDLCRSAAKDPSLRTTLIGIYCSAMMSKVSTYAAQISRYLASKRLRTLRSVVVRTLVRYSILNLIAILDVSTPNIKSKGPIPPRTARIPAFWASRPPPVQEIDTPTVPTWTWLPTREGCRIVLQVPDLVRSPALHDQISPSSLCRGAITGHPRTPTCSIRL